MLSTSPRNVWSLSWILKAEEGWGGTEISTKGVVARENNIFSLRCRYPPTPCPVLSKSNVVARQSIASL